MLLTVVGKFWFIQYRFNTIKGSVHNCQSGCFAIESLQRAKKIKYKQQNTQHISQRKRTALFQHNRQAENCRNTNTVKDIQPHCPRRHFPFKVKRCVSGTLEIAGQFFGFFSKQVIALNNTNTLYKRQHRIGQPFALLLTACCFSQRNFIHPLRYQPCQNSNYCGDQAKLPIQIKHEGQQNQRGQQIAHHVSQRTHSNFFNEYHVGTEDRTDLSNIAGSEITHRKFPQMATQFDTLVSEHQISRCTLQAVTKIMNEHLNHHNSSKTKSHIKAGLPSNCLICKSTQNHKGQKNRHF